MLTRRKLADIAAANPAAGILLDALAAAVLAAILAVPFLGFRMVDSAQGLSLGYRFSLVGYAALAVFLGRLALGFAARHWSLFSTMPRFKLPALAAGEGERRIGIALIAAALVLPWLPTDHGAECT